VETHCDEMAIRSIVLQSLRDVKGSDLPEVEPNEDAFIKFGLTSLEIFSVLVKLEKALGVVIGQSLSDFERIRTFGGLQGLLLEKVNRAGARPKA